MTDATARLTIRLLGAPEVQVAGIPLSLNHQKAQALVYYLAATGQPHTREHLATLLWSEATSTNAHHSLRSTLYHLRQAFRARGIRDCIIEAGDLLQLAVSVDECDVLHLRELLTDNTERTLNDAVALYRGHFLQGFTVSNAPLFDEWVRFEEADLNRAFLSAHRRLVAWAESHQKWDDAIDHLQRLVQADPIDEEVQQRLMGLYLRQGAVGLALRQYQQFEARLRQELSVPPSAETQALFHQILQRRHDVPPPTRSASRLSTHISQALPFVGRDRLLSRLLAIAQDTITGRGATILLQGEAGIGKTRLLEELAQQLEHRSPSWTVLRGACSPFDDLLPLGPFIEAFQSAPVGDLSDLITLPDGAAPDARGRFTFSVSQALRTLTRNGPILLTIDDLQWANSSTLDLFGFLAMRSRDLPMLLVGTVQNAQVIPALQRLIDLGRRRGLLHALSLSPLTSENVAEFLNGQGISPTSTTAFVEWLHIHSDGSPFVLGEIMAQMRAEGIVEPMGVRWQFDSRRWLRWRITFSLPETTHDLVTWRLSNLTSDARHVLDILAVAGEPLGFMLLGELLNFQPDQLLSVLEDLSDRQLIVESASDQFGLPHYLLRETLLHHMSQIRRRILHRKLAQVLEQHLGQLADLRQIALHAVAGEDVDRSRRYGLQLLADLPQPYGGAERVEFVHHLYDLIAPSAVSEEMLLLTGVLGRLHQSHGALVAAKQWQSKNLEIARKMNDPIAQATAHFEMAEVALVTYDYRTATQAAEAGLSVCAMLTETPPAPLVGRGHRLQGAALAMEGSDLGAAASHLQTAAAVQRETGNWRDLCATLFELGNVAAQRGDLQRALHFYEEAASAAEAGRVHYYLALAWNNHAYHSLLLGDIEVARRSADKSLKLAETYEMLGVLLYLLSTQGEISLYLGEWAVAAESFQRGSALAEELGSLERQAGYRAGLALAARGQGDLSGASSLLAEALSLIAGQGYWHLQTRISLWLAETFLLLNRTEEARTHVETALGTARSQGRDLWLVQAERLRARLIAAEGEWSGANALFEETLGQATRLGIAIEVARTKAAWGEAALNYSPDHKQGHALVKEARTVLTAHGARAELGAITNLLV